MPSKPAVKKVRSAATSTKKPPASSKAISGKSTRFTVDSLLKRLKSLGDAQTRKTWLRHGAPESSYGVKIGSMKPLQKAIMKNHELAMGLYASGIPDAMYFACLIADETKMTKQDLQQWVQNASWSMVSEFSVPWVASETPHAMAMGLKWIDSKTPKIAAAGWATLASHAGITPDEHLPLDQYQRLLDRAADEIGNAEDRVKYAMNGFVIAVGAAVAPLYDRAMKVAQKIGKVEIDMGDTSCKVPLASDYLKKAKSMGRVGKKRAEARC